MITVYTTPTCAYCPMVKKFLDMHKQEYKVVNLEEDPEMRQKLLEKTGAMTVPITVVERYDVQHGSNQLVEDFVVGWQPAKLKELIA